ncbi:hypothetical protein PABG_11965 [Paracoccidioides brasiliensis Pb03]|nr:hypothetical protein PABG_11965 [Paracoccidioides brasiliensis Pb03]
MTLTVIGPTTNKFVKPVRNMVTIGSKVVIRGLSASSPNRLDGPRSINILSPGELRARQGSECDDTTNESLQNLSINFQNISCDELQTNLIGLGTKQRAITKSRGMSDGSLGKSTR